MRSTSQACCTVALRLLGGNGILLDNDVGRFIADAEAIGQSLTANCVDQDITTVGRNTIRLWAEQYGKNWGCVAHQPRGAANVSG
jgi:hypothetical protein